MMFHPKAADDRATQMFLHEIITSAYYKKQENQFF